MDSFEDIGLREELLRRLEEEDFTTPTAVQAAVIPALRRGGNLVARASAGSGKTLAYALGVLDRIKVDEDASEGEEAATALRILILAPTIQEAERVATSLVPFALAIDLQVAVAGAGWGTAPSEAAVLVAPPGPVMEAVQSSEVKLDRLEAIVVDGASIILELGEWERVDALLDLIPRDAQRAIFSSAFPEPVEDLVARRVKRALRYPAEPAIADERAESTTEGSIGFVLASESAKFDLLSRQLAAHDRGAPPPIIFCRNDERAADLAEQLVARGFLVGEPSDVDVDVAIAAAGADRAEVIEEVEGAPGQSISFDVPPDAATLAARHAGDGDAVVLLEPRELAHLREIARLARFTARSAPTADALRHSASDLARFRDEVRRAIEGEDLSAQMLVLEPLFDEYTPAEIAAAAAALLRRRRPQSEHPASRPSESAGSAGEKGAPTGSAPVTWARLFVGVGSRDEVKAGDLVGALAGEADIPGSRIGKIEIRDSFSIVEVQADVAEKVIRAVNGTTIKGRSVRVDFDRGGPARRPPTRGGGAPRRTTRRPPGADRS